MHISKVIPVLLCCLFAATSTHAQDDGIEIQEYLDHLYQQFIDSSLVNSERGMLVHQGRTHVELNVVVKKNEAGEISSYVVMDNENINPAAVHKLSFDINLVSSVQKAELAADTPTAEQTVTATATPAQKSEKPAPWYRTFFTW